MKIAYHTDVGKKRAVNQDRVCALTNEFNQSMGIVLDGMGGHQAGEFAAGLGLDIMCQAFIEHGYFASVELASEWLVKTIEAANQSIFENASTISEHAGMGTTIVVSLWLDEAMIISHVGDSRAYIYENKTLTQLTKDHTYVNLLVESGSINKEQAKVHPKKNVLLKALGVFEDLVVTSQVFPHPNGTLLLCSDGLYNFLAQEECIDILEKEISLEEKVLLLTQLANDHGGQDNISVVLMSEKGDALNE